VSIWFKFFSCMYLYFSIKLYEKISDLSYQGI
jgi:hypothetical protein